MITDLFNDGGIFAVIAALLVVYIFWTIIVVITDDRDPASSIAWILLIVAVPLLGLIIYLLFGRNTKVLTSKFKENLKISSAYLNKQLRPLRQNEDKVMKKLQGSLAANYFRLLNLVKNTSNSTLTLNNNVEVLQNGSEKFPRLLKDLEKAKDYIHIEYFIWAEDEMTQEFQDLLIKKAESGVEVKVLYDSVGSVGKMSKAYIRRFKDSPVEFHSLLSPTSFVNIISAQYRSHNKIVVIDGKIGYTGGMNMGQEYVDGGKKFPGWRDTSIRVTGEVVAPLHAVFAKSWFEARGEKLASRYFKYEPAKTGNLVPIQLTYSTPYTKFESIKKTYFEMITSAQKNIYIQSPYFIPDRAMVVALQNAALSGVDVKFMMTGLPDKKSALGAAHSYFKSMIDAGVEIYLYETKFLHSKTIVIDSEVGTVGTANFDIRSFKLDYEVIALMYNQKIAKELEADFKFDLKSCRRFTLKTWQETPFKKRLFYSICRLASPLM
jgi:cardiolipin synthase